MSSAPDNVCAEHGQLKRSCTTCEAIRDANRVAELEAQVATLEARNAGLEKDRARMEWIESKCGQPIQFGQWYFPPSYDVDKTVRAAIDRVMAIEVKEAQRVGLDHAIDAAIEREKGEK